MFRKTVSTCVVRPVNAASRLLCYPLATRVYSRLSFHPEHVTRALLCFKPLSNKPMVIMARRKSHSNLARERLPTAIPISIAPSDNSLHPKPRASQRIVSQLKSGPPPTNPDRNPNILDGPDATRASPDAEELDQCNLEKLGIRGEDDVKKEDKDNNDSDSPLSDLSDTDSPVKAGKSKSKQDRRVEIQSQIADNRKDEPAVQASTTKQKPANDYQFLDPEAEGDEEADEEEIQAALSRPPPVHSNCLPLPWKGRLGYVRRDFSTPSFANISPGLFVHVPTLFKSAGLQLSNLPHRIDSRKPAPSQISK